MSIKSMSMKNELDRIILEKTNRAEALERLIADARSRYGRMTDKQLAEAMRDVAGMKKEIADLHSWCAWAKLQINKFLTPASISA